MQGHYDITAVPTAVVSQPSPSLEHNPSEDLVQTQALLSIVANPNPTARVDELSWEEVDDALRSIESDTGTLGALLTTPSYVTSASEGSRQSGGIAPLRAQSKMADRGKPRDSFGAIIAPDDEFNEKLAEVPPLRGEGASKANSHVVLHPESGSALSDVESANHAPSVALPPTPIGADLELSFESPSARFTAREAPAPLLPLLPGEVSSLSRTTVGQPNPRRTSFHTVQRRHSPSGALSPQSEAIKVTPGSGFAGAHQGANTVCSQEPPTYAETMQSAIYPTKLAPAIRQAPGDKPPTESTANQVLSRSSAIGQTLMSGHRPPRTVSPQQGYPVADPTCEPPQRMIYFSVGPSAHASLGPPPSQSQHFASPIPPNTISSSTPSTSVLSLVSAPMEPLSIPVMYAPSASLQQQHHYFHIGPAGLPQQQQHPAASATQSWPPTPPMQVSPFTVGHGQHSNYIHGSVSTQGPTISSGFVGSAPSFPLQLVPQQYLSGNAVSEQTAPNFSLPPPGVGQVVIWRT